MLASRRKRGYVRSPAALGSLPEDGKLIRAEVTTAQLSYEVLALLS